MTSRKDREERIKIVAPLRRDGLTVREIAAKTGWSHGTTQRAVKDFESGEVEPVSAEELNGQAPATDGQRDQLHTDAAPDTTTAIRSVDRWDEFWADPQVHPAAALLPMMGDIELAELARDIEANGLMESIVLWRDDAGELFLLDGRNRLAALARLGITNPDKAPAGLGGETVVVIDGVDPTTYVLSANVHRRHLTSEQKRQALAAYLKADPTVSNRKVAKDLGVSDKTAAKVRSDLAGTCGNSARREAHRHCRA